MKAIDRIAEASAVRPSQRQLAWQQLEFYGFIHFGMNTMTNREWGPGHEDPKVFNPQNLDAGQWVDSLRSAGMRGLILTCKHHDGFCLWPSEATRHSVASSPWKAGRGDVVADVARACAAQGIKFGIYLSPWDRTEARYGSGAPYDDFFVAQLTELLSLYGPVFSVWFDGANGEGANGKTQLYDWERYFACVRRLQPDAVISVCGPDVRWCGNEAGAVRANEWSVVPKSLQDAERIASRSQQADDGDFSRQVRSDEDDLGSRQAIMDTSEELVWYPAEVNTSIRPGWFHHPEHRDQVRSADDLFSIYCGSVGGNATFLLNVPPNADGRIDAVDRDELAKLGRMIGALKERDVVSSSVISTSSGLKSWVNDAVSWTPLPNDKQPSFQAEWTQAVVIDGFILGEDIAFGQQIDELVVEGLGADGQFKVVAALNSIGYRRIKFIEPLSTRALRLRIDAARGPISLSTIMILRTV